MTNQRVVVIGASHKPERYSNMAIRALKEKGHTVIPVNPAQKTIEGLAVVANLEDAELPIDTVTMYVNPEQGEKLKESISALKPGRVILNPGTESSMLKAFLEARGVTVIEGCTLVMLRTNTF